MKPPPLRTLPAVAAPGPVARAVPVATILLASLAGALPVIASAPTMPPFGLLFALAWRLLHPNAWRPWAALPLGLFDDLCSGQPLGTAAASWTILFLALGAADYRLLWREFWLDWAIAALCILFALIAGAFAVGAVHGGMALVAPQAVVAILCYPLVERVCWALDRWRFAR